MSQLAAVGGTGERVPNRFIEKLRGFRVLGPDDEAAITAVTSKPRKVAAKRDLIREGDHPGPIILVLEGWACRYKILHDGRRQVLAFLMPGDCCDLHAGLLEEMDHSIQTITPALVATIGRVELDRIMDEHRGVAKSMYLAQLVDEGTMRAWITSMGRRTSLERVAHLMCELYLRARNVGLTANHHFTFPVSQALLADALGMTPVHINRMLGELRLQGAMTMQRGMLLIHDPDKLVRIAGFDRNYLHQRLRRVVYH